MENLKQFRDRFPGFRPYARRIGALNTQLEFISWPYEEDGEIVIKVREFEDPTTMETRTIEWVMENTFTQEELDNVHVNPDDWRF